ncbi:MAG: AI-2E family transporter [Polyangiaceae bacterium]
MSALTRNPEPARDSELPVPLSSAAVTPETRKGRRIALDVLLVLSFLAAAWIASPLWVGLMLGMVMAFTAQPLYRRLVASRASATARHEGRHKYVAAALVTLLSAFVAMAVGTVSLYILARELLVIGTLLQQRLAIGTPLDALGPRALHFLDQVHVNHEHAAVWLNDLLTQAQGKAMAAAAAVLQATTGGMLGLLIALITELYVLVEWPQLALRLESILPLDPRHTRALMIEFRDVSRSALVGTVATAIIQGMLAAVGYAIAGVATPVTWGLVTAISSLLPVVGTFLVWVPIAGYLAWKGEIGSGIFVLLWGLFVVSIATDYVIRPRLVGKKGHGHPLLMLVSLIGGIEVMGLAGLIVAPILMSLFIAVLKIYEREEGISRSALRASPSRAAGP